MKRAGWPALALAAVTFPGAVFASGYAIHEQGAAIMGMAGAGVAAVRDPSAVYYNPAALTRLEGTQLSVGGALLSPVTSFAGTADYPGYGVTESMKNQHFPLPNLYLTKRYESRWAVGVAVNAPFGLGIEWEDPETFTGRRIVTKADLKSVNAAVSAAYELNPQWSGAIGGNVLFAKALLRSYQVQDLMPGGGSANVAVSELESGFIPGYGWNAAVLYSPGSEWRFGATYRSKVVVDADADATFEQIPYTAGTPTFNAQFNAAVAAALPPDQGVSTVLRFPATWTVGTAWTRGGWTAALDLLIIEWSVFTDLPIEFETTPEISRVIIEDYNDSFQIRAGAEHRLDRFTYRFGYYFDQGAAPDESVTPLLPETDRHGVSLGLGLPLNPSLTLDAYDLAIFATRAKTNGVERDNFNGEYKTFVNAFGLALSWRF
jgi:long-chain fatty acid transport protein